MFSDRRASKETKDPQRTTSVKTKQRTGLDSIIMSSLIILLRTRFPLDGVDSLTPDYYS